MAVGSIFFFAAPTAQNSPKLHFRFMNYFIQPSRVGSLGGYDQGYGGFSHQQGQHQFPSLPSSGGADILTLPPG